MTSALLDAKGVTLQYKTPRHLVTATYRVDFSVHQGDRYVILYFEGMTTPTGVKFEAVRDLIAEDVRDKKININMANLFQRLKDEAAIDNFLAGTTQTPKSAADREARDALPRPSVIGDSVGGRVDLVQRGRPARGAARDPHRTFAEDDRAIYRDEGRLLIGALVRHLDADDVANRDAAFDEAAAIVRSHAVRLAHLSASLTDGVALFVAARQPFLAEVGTLARRRSLDPGQLTRLYEEATVVLDRLLLEFVDAYRHTSEEIA